MSIKPNLNEDEMEVVIVATGFDTDKYIITIKPEDIEKPVDDTVKGPEEVETTQDTSSEPTETEVETPKESEDVSAPTPVPTPTPTPVPIHRPISTPTPIARPARNFAEFEDCKRTPAYIKHGVQLTVASKLSQVGGIEKEQPSDSTEMSLFE
jgi:hypothetical protein